MIFVESAVVTRTRGRCRTCHLHGPVGNAGRSAHAGKADAPCLRQLRLATWIQRRAIVGARIEEAWWLYHPDRMREEVGLARQVHANCIRLWIEFAAWMAEPDKVTANFLDAVKAIADMGMKAMPCLLNRWHDDRFDYGGTYTEMLSAAGFGWMGWALREGKAISTCRDRYDANGINGQGFHPFFTKEGKLREGLEFLTEKPTLLRRGSEPHQDP